MTEIDAQRFASLLYREIARLNSFAETAELLGSGDDARVNGTVLLLNRIMDHVTEFELAGDGIELESACESAISRLRAVPDRADPAAPAITGLLGLTCLTVRLLRRRFESPDPARHREVDDQCRRLFTETPIRAAIFTVYRPGADADSFEKECWEALDFSSLDYHKAGTTSFIMTARGKRQVDQSGADRKVAVKCVLFPWNRLSAVARSTAEYARVYGRARTPDVVVHPIASTDRWVLMPFQEGETLTEHLMRFEAERPSARARLDKAVDVANKLLRALSDLARGGPVDSGRPERQHLDLSPSNILLPSRSPDVRLIDLGPNHLYSRQVGIAEHDDSVYIAPETKNRGSSATADAYSLGIILMQILSGTVPRGGRAPDEIWEMSPALGRALEDLVEEDCNKRLLLLKDDRPFAFEHLAEFLGLAFDLAAGEPESSMSTGRRWWARVMPSSGEVKAQYRQWALGRRSRLAHPHHSYLLFFSLLSTVCWWFVFTKTALLSVGDLMTFSVSLESFPRGTLLAAYIIALSQGLSLAKLYQTVLARITLRNVPGLLARSTEMNMRFIAVAGLPSVFLTVYWKPEMWPWVGAAIAGAVSLVNFLVFVTIKRIHRAGLRARLSTVPPAKNMFARGYEQWWWTQLLYSLLVLFLAIGMQIGWLKDTWAYVTILAGSTIGVHYLAKCVVAGPAVRGGIARMFCAGERIAILQDRGRLRNTE